ncbi:LOW QUALITY PROTEIN: testis-expressed protein 45 [Apus apus]|uniref:LOW QUALITY PROTEIN: testis-expressed protein 45 n=1 Tax=Apus apus TaxID=8895 RepID=UPI0021F8BD33|nr:LOW QUALITY PROTEIN: testis-expressed protein 45 [Apus apus]
MKASHIQLGSERWASGSARQPWSHSEFPPFWGVYRPAPAPPPPSGHVLNQAAENVGETCSETHRAFPEQPLQPVAAAVPLQPGVRMHADPRIRVLASTARETFPWPHAPLQRPSRPAALKQKDHIPYGDREKIGLLPSVYTSSYPAHEAQPLGKQSLVRCHTVPFPCLAGCVPTIPRDGQSSYSTSYQAQFKGEWNPPAKPGEKQVSSVKFGDSRSSGSVSEQKCAYGAPEEKTHRAYNKELAASQIHHTNVQLGDGCTSFSTSTSEHFPVHKLEPVTAACPNRYSSSIPRGDEDPERNRALARTMTQVSYPEPDRQNLPPKPDLLLRKNQSSFSLGEGRAGAAAFGTTQQAAYQPPPRSQRVTADSRSHHQSHVPFNYHTDESPVTTTQAMLVPHRQQKQGLSEDKLQQIKYSHLGLPWRARDLFRTEQKDQFTPKSRGPAEIQKGDCQVSSIPLGTLKEFRPHRKVHFAP